MKRLLLSLLAILACASDLGAVTYHYVVAETSQSQLETTSTDCENLACTASSVPWCIQSGTLYHCNVSGGSYDAVGGTTAAGGSNAQVQFNNSGVFGGDAGFTYNASTDTITLAGNVTLSSVGATVDGKNLDLVPANTRQVHICSSGCEYTTLNSACAGETSTAAAPIIFHVHAGRYIQADTMCSGQDHATFKGDGAGVTTLTGIDHGFGEANGNDCSADVKACKGALNLGTSTNIEVYGFTLKGGSRGLWWNGAGTGGGQSYIHDNEFITNATGGDEDCFYWVNFAAGSEIRIKNNLCTTDADGFTVNNDGTTRIFSEGNTFHTSATVQAQTALWAFYSIPCYFYSKNDSFWTSGGRSAANNIYAYQFNGSPTDLTGTPTAAGCSAGTGRVIIQSPSIKMANTTTNGNSGLMYGIRLQSTSGELGTVDILGASCEVSTADTTTGAVYCVINELASFTGLNVVGGRFRATGGPAGNTRDIMANGAGANPVNVSAGTDYTTDTSTTIGTPIVTRHLSVGGAVTFSGGGAMTISAQTNTPTITTTDAGLGLFIDNTDEANNEAGPAIKLCDSTSGAGDDCYHIYSSTSGLEFDGALSTNLFRIRQPADIIQSLLTRFQIAVTGASMEIGSGSNSDANQLKFDSGTTDATLVWVDTANRLNLTNVEVFRTTPVATAPATCSIGDWYVDTSGAYCACTSSNTWTNMTGVGSCV